jgi:tetratricopeptide (TPR) repeat protein
MSKVTAALVAFSLAALSISATPSAISHKMERKVKLHGRNKSTAEERAIINLAGQGKAEESLRECRRCLSKQPNDNHIKLLEAQILRFLIEDTEAQKRLEELRSAKDLTGEELHAAAMTADGLEQWKLTKYFAEKSLPLIAEEDRYRLHLQLGDAFSKLNLFNEAENNYLKAFKLKPSGRALDTLIYFYMVRKKCDLVVKYCTLSLDRNKDDNSMIIVKHHRFRGESLLQLGRYKDSLADFDYCLKKTPSDSYIYRKRAEAYEKLGRKKDAEADRLRANAIEKSALESDALFGRVK